MLLSIAYFFLFLTGGVLIVRFQLPRLRPAVRTYIGLSAGWLMLMWLPALWACAVRFGAAAHLLALLTVCLLTLAAWLFRDRRPLRLPEEEDRRALRLLLVTVLPLTLLGGYLEYTHTIRAAADGSLWVGQSTYGDLQLHLAITTSAVNAEFPLHNSLLRGATMAYPYLSDTVASSMYLMGMPLAASLVVTGTAMLALVFTGFFLLASRLCRRKGAAALAFFLLFLNGGLGFLYTLDGSVNGGVITGAAENLKTVMTGYYMTPTNQPDPHNLRWVNLICDMFVPQRGILGGWTLLLPCLNLLIPPLCFPEEERGLRRWLLLAVFAGGLPLVHTHSYLALVLFSAGAGAYDLLTAPKGEKTARLGLWAAYAALAALLSVPQLIGFTFRQVSDSGHFLRLWFNWANNRNGDGQLVDGYFRFYLKNIGLPYLMILFALLRRMPKDRESPEAAAVRQNRLIACGAFLIYLAAECVRFQPNVYDNNKLFYVWFLLCLPMAADWAADAYSRLAGLPGRRVIAALGLILCFASAGLTVAREAVSNYQVYNAKETAAAEFVKENTPEHSLFLTGTQHLNPVSALAGRDIVCGPDLYLYFHGFSTGTWQWDVANFYADPANHRDVLDKYGVDYIYLSSYERSSYDVDEPALEALFQLVYDQDGIRVFAAEEEKP